MDFAIQAACSFLPAPIAPHAANFLRSFQSDASGESRGPVVDFLKAQTPLLVSLIGLYFAATSMFRTLRVAYRSSIFFAKWGSLAAIIGIIYQACTSSDPARSLQSSLSTIVHSAGALGGLSGSALYWLSMFVGGETGDNVRKAAGWLFPNSAAGEKARERRERETADGPPPAYGTRSRSKTAKKGTAGAANPLADLWNSATGAKNEQAAGAGSDGVADFLSKIVGAAGGADAVDQLKGALGGANVQDVLGALAGAVGGAGGQNNGGRR